MNEQKAFSTAHCFQLPEVDEPDEPEEPEEPVEPVDPVEPELDPEDDPAVEPELPPVEPDDEDDDGIQHAFVTPKSGSVPNEALLHVTPFVNDFVTLLAVVLPP
ncbi:hypothetical protein FAZ95_26545 [Trinickia violacea]|uniref:Uncharacterized protein n=1 Tax=Trinickia violacea TaxID=2571746 RepID=A0A4P8IWL9_9BURK|nr:hypothetical protein [Trinickia violacea]QCP52707.1 hypothetical protein FAZ95_26545 [Trinickia violacea]